GGGRPLRRHGLAEARARRRRRRRPADRPRGRRPRVLHRLRRPARRAARPRAALAGDRRPHERRAGRRRQGAGLALGGGHVRPAILDRVIDWTLAGTVARGIAGLQPAGDPEPFEDVEAHAVESERLVSEYTGLVAADPVPRAEALHRQGWIDANLRS